MKKVFILFFIICTFSFSLDFKVASYNVENFFDLNYDKTEYKEYIPHTKSWNKTSYEKKLNNVLKVVKDIDASVLALQEIESQEAFNAIKNKTSYKYGVFLKKDTSSVGVGLLSNYEIAKTEKIDADRYDKHSRYILKATLKIDNIDLIVYVNHWRSKRAAESQRIKYALKLKEDIQKLKRNQDYIVLGDLNSNYDEYITFKYEDNLNDTYGLTGINHILNTIKEGNLISKNDLVSQDDFHYNLWLELPQKERFSTKFRNENNTPDNILISDELFDDHGISYVNNSFEVFKPTYLYDKQIKRWDIKNLKGYSDHLPIYAVFSTKKQDYALKSSLKEELSINKIGDLYNIQKLNSAVKLEDVTVIYKSNKTAVIKQQNDRSIAVYNPPKELKVGFKYNITIDKIDSYHGLKEIKNISSFQEVSKYEDYKNLYLKGDNLDLNDMKYQNEIITDLSGVFKKGYLYYGKNLNEKIKIYFRKGIKKPEENGKIVISSGHLGIYKSQIQIIIHKEDDYIN